MDQGQAYLVLVRRVPCIVPGCDCDRAGGTAHHVYVGGGAMKCSDFDTVALCDYHHTSGPQAVDKVGWGKMTDEQWWRDVAKMTPEEGIALTRQRVEEYIIARKLRR